LIEFGGANPSLRRFDHLQSATAALSSDWIARRPPFAVADLTGLKSQKLSAAVMVKLAVALEV
jgi:hypothetical protein